MLKLQQFDATVFLEGQVAFLSLKPTVKVLISGIYFFFPFLPIQFKIQGKV